MRTPGLALGVLLSWSVAGAQGACVPQVSTDGVFLLRWTPPPLAGVPLIGYALERQVDAGPWLPWMRLPPPVTSVVDLVTPGTTVAYRVAAEYAPTPGRPVRSAWAPEGTPPPCVTVPEAGVVLTAGRGCDDHCIVLTWQPPSPSARVMLERQVSPGPPKWQPLGTTLDSRYVDTAVSPRKRYGYHARTDTSTWGPVVWVDSSTSQEGVD